jgi:serine/threonine protein kinase
MEEVLTFGVNEGPQSDDATQQYCISIERAQLTLDEVVDGMVQKGRYRHDANLQKKYAAKICYVLRSIAKALRHLHEAGAVHGNLCLQNCGRFEQSWKLRGRLGFKKIGEPFDTSRFHQSFPPEALKVDEQEGEIFDSDDAPVSFRSDMSASPAIDIWSFGKLAYEAIVGQPMINFDSSKSADEDVVSLLEILEWGESNMRTVFENLLESGVPESGAEMITSCLFARPEERPRSMHQILENSFWKDMRRFRERSKRSRRHDDTTSSVYTETTRSMNTETSEI